MRLGTHFAARRVEEQTCVSAFPRIAGHLVVAEARQNGKGLAVSTLAVVACGFLDGRPGLERGVRAGTHGTVGTSESPRPSLYLQSVTFVA
jgi:hypothetical protein